MWKKVDKERMRPGTMKSKRLVIAAFLILTLALSYGIMALIATAPVKAASPYYVDGATGDDTWDGTSPTVGVFPVGPKKTIQAAIDAAGAGDVISVAAGTYIKDLKIPGTKANLEIKAASPTPTIKGVQNSDAGDPPYGEWPLARPGIEILASGVKVHGFTIESPNYAADRYTSGTVIGAINVEIYDNAFKVTPAANADEISQALQTYVTGDSSGLNVHNNTFTNLVDVAAAGGYEGIYLNPDTGSGPMTVKNNMFSGQVCRAVTTVHSSVTISGNSIVTDLAPNSSPATAPGWQGINVGNGTDVSDVSVTGNTVKGSASAKGFGYGIRLCPGTSLTNVNVSGNTIQLNTYGVYVKAGASGTKANQNDISGNTTAGVQNDDTAQLDAQNNWWGDVLGPGNVIGIGDKVVGNVDYNPWLKMQQPQITAVDPSSVDPNPIFLTLKLTGSGFRLGATVWLQRDGGAPIPAAWTVVTATEVQATYWGLIGYESAKYDVVLKDPDGFEARLYDGFEIKTLPPAPPCGTGGGTTVVMLGFAIGLLYLAESGRLRKSLRRKAK